MVEEIHVTYASMTVSRPGIVRLRDDLRSSDPPAGDVDGGGGAYAKIRNN